jgi:hypothetical protein
MATVPVFNPCVPPPTPLPPPYPGYPYGCYPPIPEMTKAVLDAYKE